jgi:hypothetical protein
MKERLTKLLEVKTIITLTLVFGGLYGFIAGMIGADIFSGWVGMIMIFFFQKDANK